MKIHNCTCILWLALMAPLCLNAHNHSDDTHEHDSADAGKGGLQPMAAEQASLTPDTVLNDLLRGNERYVEGDLTERPVLERRRAATAGQYPKAFVLSCIDSRVPVEQVFDQGIGDIFVGRVAGNVEGIDQLGSMEYAAAVAGVKLILVLGHESCGAVKGACDDVRLGNVTPLLAEIKPAVAEAAARADGETSSANKAFVDDVIEINVRKTVEDIRMRSPVLADLEAEGKIRITGAVYSLHTGKVTLVN